VWYKDRGGQNSALTFKVTSPVQLAEDVQVSLGRPVQHEFGGFSGLAVLRARAGRLLGHLLVFGMILGVPFA
jgi:hypothetical protein